MFNTLERWKEKPTYVHMAHSIGTCTLTNSIWARYVHTLLAAVILPRAIDGDVCKRNVKSRHLVLA